jgi:hypothetical protein
MRSLFCLAIIFFAFTLTGTVTGEDLPVLSIRDCRSGRIVLEIPVSYGQPFVLRYTHSVDLTPVFEVFRPVKDRGILLVETYFRMFGAGMGHWEGHGVVVEEEGWIRIKDIDRMLGSFFLRVGSRGVDHTLLVNGKEWDLSGIAEGRLVEIALAQEGGLEQE